MANDDHIGLWRNPPMRIRYLLATSLVTVATSTAMIATSASAAPPPCQRLFIAPYQTAAGVAGFGELLCVNPDQDGTPIRVTLQKRLSGTFSPWVTVAQAEGEAEYLCENYDVANDFRLKELPLQIRGFYCT
jgi:hypothetical protein